MIDLMRMRKKLFYALSVLVCLLGVSENAWAGSYYTWLRVSTDDSGKGLVYANSNKSSNPGDGDYGELLLSDRVSGSNGANQSFYGWAKPARGYTFATWTGYEYAGTDKKDSESAATFPSPKQTTGAGDLIYARSWGGNAGDPAAGSAKASWNAATSYNVVYKEPVGGSYTVDYSYKTINSSKKFATSTEKLELAPGSGDKQPYGISDGSQEGFSYAADVVTLSTDAGNFVGWYEDGVEKSTANPYTYPVSKSANVTALFKWIEPVAPEEKHIRTTNNSADVNESVVFSMDNVISTWATADFTVTLVGATGSGTFSLCTISYNATDGELTVPFTYNANGHWEAGSSVTIQVAPVNSSYGTTASVLVKAIAQEDSPYQARVSGDDFATQEGDLTDMLDVANAHTDATLTLLQSVAVSSPLVVSKSMTLDLNNWVLSSTAANKIISVEGTDTKLTISDNSFLKGGEIQLTRNANAAITAIEVTGANRLLYNHGKMTVTNESSSADAKAYGIYVSGAGNAVMQGGSINVESDHDARGVFIASGNATLNVGKIEATAKTQAYALYSGGKINVDENISLTATTTTSNDAAALYLTGGTAVVDNVAMTATSAGTNAYGAYVTVGKLTLNGGSIASSAVTSNAYGVYITTSGNVTIQQQANITAEVTNTSTGTRAYGIQNLGTLTLKNSTILATSRTYPTAISSETTAISTTIEGGTYNAVATADHAYGLHHQYGTLNVDGGTFTATSGTTAALAVRAGVNGTIANATMIAETLGGATARGFTAGVEGITVSLTNCIIKAKSATSTADAIYSRANVTATGCELEAKTLSGATAQGFYVEKGTNVLTNTSATVESFTTNAYGINYAAGTLTVNGGSYHVTAKQATAGAAAETEVYGVKVANGKTANLSNASFTVSATNGSFSKKAYGAYTGTGTINSNGCTYNVSAATLSYGVFGDASSTLNLQNNTIYASTTGTTSARGIYSAGTFTVNGDDVTSDTKTYDSYPLYFSAAAHGQVLGGKFMAKGTSSKSDQIIAPINTAATAANVQVKGGFFSDNVRLRYYVPNGYDIYGVDPNAPEYAQKYYYTVNDHLPYENVCYITEVNTGFPTLEEAFDYARNHSGSTYNIIMTQPYTLPAGNYSLPANAKLVVPDRVSRTTAIGTIAERQFPDQDLITENRCLTFASGVNLDVYGMIEVSAKQYTVNVGRIAYVLGPYGRIHLQEGSTVTLNSGAKINAWGYITGQGEIRVKNGAEVREFFQIHDMKAASAITDWTSSTNKSTYKAFLMNQYYIQSIEAPTKYYYGGKLIGSLSITSNATAATSVKEDNAQIVAPSDAFFTVDTDDESAWVRKTYDPSTDRIIWETNSSASLGHLKVEMSSYGFNSKDYVLPFTNNMTIHALSGIFNITQSTVLLPGSEVIIDKTATLNINELDVNDDPMGLYLYDLAQWGKYYDSNSKYFIPAIYSPSWTNGVCPRGDGTSNACLKDAAIYVKGKITVNSALYTTAGGAAIYSDDENAGTIEFKANAAADGSLYRTYNGGGETAVTAAKLRNGGETGADANMTPTKDVAEEDDTYAYMDIDEDGVYTWTNLATVDLCVVKDKNTSVYYAKPQGYVAITSDTEDPITHLFYSVEGERKFIQQMIDAGCVWWEVTQVDETSVYYCASNNTYYEYDDNDGWVEVKRTVTFYFTDPKSEDADKKKVLTVNYGAVPDVSIVSNPSKAEDAAATYQFSGWRYMESETVHAYTATDYEPVYENGTYYLPVFTSITKKYTITFNDAKNGANVPVEVFFGDHPSYDPIKDATAQYSYIFLNWTDAANNTYAIDDELPTVTGAVTYTAHWSQIVNKYTITWKNGEEVLETDTKQPYGTATTFNSELPTKEMDNNYVYAFSGWRSSMTGQTYANGSTPTVAGETTYEAQYATTPRYTVTFANYDAAELQKEQVTAGEQPIYKGLTPARVRDVDGYYKFTGWKNLSGTFYAKNATLPDVSAKETYTAQYDYVTDLYYITLRNVKGQGDAAEENIWSGWFGEGSTPFYDPDGDDIADAPTKASTAQYTYTFDGWSLTQDGAKLDPVPEVTEAATYWALFKQSVNKYTITFANVDGNNAEETVEVEYGTTPEVLATLVSPTKADACNTFAHTGWSPAIQSVTGPATYTAVFSETPDTRTFAITFDGDNDVAPVVMVVECGTKPVPATPTKEDAAFYYTFTGWSDGENVYATADLPIASAEATYTAQYTQTLRSYTIRFENYDHVELQSSSFAYGATPTYSGDTPKKPMDEVGKKAYTFSGWSPAIVTVSGNKTYTAQYNEVALVATVTPAGGEPEPYSSWASALNAAKSSAGSTLKLYANVTADNNTSLNQNMTIDLNGYTISCSTTTQSNSQMFNVTKALTIKDSGTGGKISYSHTRRYTFSTFNVSGTSLTIEGGIIESKNTYSNNSSGTNIRAVTLTNSATLTVKGGELIASSNKGDAYAVYNDNTNVIINPCDAKFKVTLNGSTSSGNAYLFKSMANVTASGGYFSKEPTGITIASGYGKRTSDISGYTHKIVPVYVITFQNWDGTTLQNEPTYAAGENPVYSGATPTKDPDGQYLYEFSGWDPAVVAVTGPTTYTAQYNAVENFVVDGNTSIDANATVTTTVVETNGTLNVKSGATLTTTDLILQSTTNASGQIVGAPRLNVTGHVYFDVQFNGEAGTANRTWYAIAVPWEVDAENGILWKEGNRKLVLGRDFDLVWYDGEERAANGDGFACWRYVEYESDKKMHPGKGYMMYFGSQFKTVRFEKTPDAPIIYTGDENAVTKTATYTLGTGDAKDGNWNSIANPAVYHATLDAGATFAQVLNNGSLDDYFAHSENPVYTTINNMTTYEFVVGKPIFVQASENNRSIVVTSVIDNAALAPRRARTNNLPEGIDVCYGVHIALDGHATSDNLFVQATEEDKADTYVIGMDLAKGGVAKNLPQLWVNRYDAKLSANTQTFINDIAEYPMSLYAPNDGEYVINTDNIYADYDLYLMQNGTVIWNLSNSAYTISLPQGTTTGYGLRIGAKTQHVATGMDEAVADAQGEIRKVIINDKVYIIRNNNVYSVDGQLVK